jgi:hypothetical protein
MIPPTKTSLSNRAKGIESLSGATNTMGAASSARVQEEKARRVRENTAFIPQRKNLPKTRPPHLGKIITFSKFLWTL